MLLKLVVSLLCVVAFLYLLFCMVLNAPILSDGNAKEVSRDIKHRWFWVMSIYIGKATVIGTILAILVAIMYFLIFH